MSISRVTRQEEWDVSAIQVLARMLQTCCRLRCPVVVTSFGDAVCIEYFARHFDVNIRVYTPVCAEPLQFPMYLDDLETHMRTVVDAPPSCPLSVYRLTHLTFESGKEVRPNYSVPVITNPIMKKTVRSGSRSVFSFLILLLFFKITT